MQSGVVERAALKAPLRGGASTTSPSGLVVPLPI